MNLEWTTDLAGHLIALDTRFGWFTVKRHGDGRKYWETHYPDGAMTHSALTRAEAKRLAEEWVPDHVPPSTRPDAAPAEGQTALTEAGDSQEALTACDRALLSYLDNTGEPGTKTLRERRAAALRNLSKLVEMRTTIERTITENVDIARLTGGTYWDTGATWADIGKALGVTKQAAQARYGKTG